jgi:hypothetical protein
MKLKLVLLAATAASVLVFSTASQAGTISMNFDTLQNDELVNGYYNGGFGSLGSGPGPNYGITFTNALVLNEFSNNEGLLVTPPNSITFLSGSGAIMDIPTGFTTGFSFNYSTPFFSGAVTVWSGLDGTGTLLATLTLPSTPDGSGTPGCGGHNYCPDLPFGVTFSGTAESVDFSGTADFVVYDDITLGSAIPGPASVPEPASMALLGAGLLGLRLLRNRKRG